MDSIAADALAASRSHPLPCETASEREFGRQHITTGIPMVSSPVTFARRVMPIFEKKGWMRASVSRGETTRCVPSQYFLATRSGMERGTPVEGIVAQGAAGTQPQRHGGTGVGLGPVPLGG